MYSYCFFKKLKNKTLGADYIKKITGMACLPRKIRAGINDTFTSKKKE